MSDIAFAPQWPVPPAGPELSALYVALLDLARQCVMQAGIPLSSIGADTDDLWDVLRARADDLERGAEQDEVAAALEAGAHEWAEVRAAARHQAVSQEI